MGDYSVNSLSKRVILKIRNNDKNDENDKKVVVVISEMVNDDNDDVQMLDNFYIKIAYGHP